MTFRISFKSQKNNWDRKHLTNFRITLQQGRVQKLQKTSLREKPIRIQLRQK